MSRTHWGRERRTLPLTGEQRISQWGGPTVPLGQPIPGALVAGLTVGFHHLSAGIPLGLPLGLPLAVPSPFAVSTLPIRFLVINSRRDHNFHSDRQHAIIAAPSVPDEAEGCPRLSQSDPVPCASVYSVSEHVPAPPLRALRWPAPTQFVHGRSQSSKYRAWVAAEAQLAVLHATSAGAVGQERQASR